MARLLLATRRSPLALAQAELVAAHLRAALGVETELRGIVTTGDRQADWSLEKKGGKGLFTGELEEALLRGEADLAVHSTKDLPGDLTPGLAIAGYLPRGDPRDLLIQRTGVAAPQTFATGSPRRRGQLALRFPAANFIEIRGNVETRLRKIAERLADATVLAMAGLQRLGISQWPGLDFSPLSLEQMVPAVGQGAIAVQCRAAEIGRFSGQLDAATARHVSLERAFQTALGAGCQTAFAAHVTDPMLYLYHEKGGARCLALTPADFAAPAATAARTLQLWGLG
jgi:hydroxymethylbilane synthase